MRLIYYPMPMNVLHEGFKNRSETFLLLIAYAFFAVLLYYQVFIKGIPPLIWDQAIHFMDSIKYYRALSGLSLPPLFLQTDITHHFPNFWQFLDT